jgi:hypothetical protein
MVFHPKSLSFGFRLGKKKTHVIARAVFAPLTVVS